MQDESLKERKRKTHTEREIVNKMNILFCIDVIVSAIERKSNSRQVKCEVKSRSDKRNTKVLVFSVQMCNKN